MIVGHQKQVKLLQNYLKSDFSLPSFLFFGPEKIGKQEIALEFVRGLLCERNVFGGCSAFPSFSKKMGQKCLACQDISDRDFLLIDNNFSPREYFGNPQVDESPYGIDTSRALIDFLSRAPSLGRHKVVVIDDAHLLTDQAQNALLKIIEEPPVRAVLILVSHQPSFIFETIQSRLVKISFGLLEDQEISDWLKTLTSENNQEVLRYAYGRPGVAWEMIKNPSLLKKFKELVLAILSFENKSAGQKLIMWKKLKEKFPEDSFDFSLWQAIFRDELFFSLKIIDLNKILSKSRTGDSLKLLAWLKASLKQSELAENFPALAETVLKQVILSSNL